MMTPFILLQFSGEKTLIVLQGQCTQLVSDLSEGHAPLLAFCDPKGRMFGSGRLVLHQGVVSLITPRDQATTLLKRLQPFLMLSRVTALQSDIDVALQINDSLQPASSHHGETTRIGEFGQTQWVIGDTQTVHSIEADAVRLSSGMGYVRTFSSELLIPQQAHYQMLGGVNFKKGCYTGQEVIARLEHLGQSKKHLWVYQSNQVINDRELMIDDVSYPIFDSVQTTEGTVALVLAPVTIESEQLTSVPFEITRQVEGQRPIKL